MNTETIRAELRTLNIAEVARRSGVSRQGLSRFVNTEGRGLQSRTADRVVRALAELRAGTDSGNANNVQTAQKEAA